MIATRAIPVRASSRLKPGGVRLLLVGIGVVLLVWATRVFDIASFPVFLDEALHIWFSEETLNRHPFVYANKYYLFSIWWWSLFAAPVGDPIWLARVVTMLGVLPGVAAVIGAGRLLAGWWGGVCAGLILLFSTYHTFFDRLTLADPLSASAVALALYFAARLVRRLDKRDAALAGLAVFLAIGAKLSALPYLGIPVAAALTLTPPGGVTVRARWRWLGTALAVELGLLAFFVLGLIVVRRNPFANAGDHVGLGDGGLGDLISRIPGSAAYMAENLLGWLGPVGLVMVALALVGLAARRRFYLLLCLIAPTLVFLTSEMQGSRYYAAPMTILALCLGVAVADAARRWGRVALGVAFAALGAWAVLVWLPLVTGMNADPLSVRLPERDYREYVVGDASGFGLDELRRRLGEQNPQRVIGLLANCQALRYASLDDFAVECPTINPNGETIPALSALLEASRDAGTVAVLEDLIYLPDSAPGRLIAAVDDPSGRPRLSVYDLTPDG